jgi:predicted 3-demethylubiquinone-9 3-methyltransferase (glyoxalase superfamily)
MTIRFQLDGFVFTAINGGPQYKFNESVSFMVECKDQGEIDFYSNALLAGGQKSYGGWLKDRFGLSWQINRKSPATKTANSDNAEAHRT